MNRIRTSTSAGLVVAPALIVCALVAAVGVGSGIADDKRRKGYGRLRPRSAECAWQKYEGVFWSNMAPAKVASPHHPKSAFTYATVLEGAVRTSVNDGPTVVYKAGQNFSEMPGDRHAVDENASKTEPAKMPAVMAVDTDTKEPLLTPIDHHK